MLRSKRLLVFGCLACLLGAGVSSAARADDFKIAATLGIGGRYRAGTWMPVTVSVVNTGPEPVHGQVQVFADDTLGPADSLFSRPVDVAASGPTPQTFQVYARGLDPDRTDVVAQLVAGPADGRVVAKTSSLSTAGRLGFSGTAIADKDLLLVGFSAGSSAFGFLNGQKWGLMHTPGGVVAEPPAVMANSPGGPSGPNSSPAVVQTAAASPADLPDRPAGYSGVDAVLLRADAPLDSLTESQTDALKAWVSAGGHLIVCAGADPTPLSDPFFAGLLPAGVGPPPPGLNAGGSLPLVPKPLPGVRVVPGPGGRPTVVEGPYGVGRVTLIGGDTQTISGWTAPVQAAFWRQALLGQPSSLLQVVANREEGGNSRYYAYYGGWDQLTDAVMRAPALDAPGAGIVGLFLLAYVLILVPINYLVLKRLDKKEWAWVTVPALVVVFAVTTYGVGYAAKGSAVFVNRAAVLEATAGQPQAGLYTELGLFSPHRTSYDMTVADPNTVVAIPNPPQDNNYGGRSAAPPGSYGRTRFVETSGDTKIQDAAVNMWAMRAFDVQTTTDLHGAIISTLTQTPQTGLVKGSLTNHTPYTLTECHLYLSGQWQTLSDLPAGGTQSVVGSFPLGPVAPPRGGPQGGTPPGWASMPTILGRNDKNDPDSDVRQRMRAALHDFIRDLGSDPSNGQYAGSNIPPPALFQPRPGEALLTGWSGDDRLPGPPLRVDGHTVTENNVTFVVVHLPLR